MNDKPLADLEHHVQRLLHPIAARPRRLRAMREELLAHLVASYDEESVRCDDLQATLQTCTRRLGRISELQQQLQRTVPAWERLIFTLVHRKETLMSPRSRSAWIWILAILAILVGPSLIMPAMALYRHEGYRPAVLWPALLGSAITLTGVALITQRLRSRRSQAV